MKTYIISDDELRARRISTAASNGRCTAEMKRDMRSLIHSMSDISEKHCKIMAVQFVKLVAQEDGGTDCIWSNTIQRCVERCFDACNKCGRYVGRCNCPK